MDGKKEDVKRWKGIRKLNKRTTSLTAAVGFKLGWVRWWTRHLLLVLLFHSARGYWEVVRHCYTSVS